MSLIGARCFKYFALIAVIVGAHSIVKAQESPETPCVASAPPCPPPRNCMLPRDDRDCMRCLVNLFGGCMTRGADPSCESTKAAQNNIYAAQKADCDAANMAAQASCEAAKKKFEAVYCPQAQ